MQQNTQAALSLSRKMLEDEAASLETLLVMPMASYRVSFLGAFIPHIHCGVLVISMCVARCPQRALPSRKHFGSARVFDESRSRPRRPQIGECYDAASERPDCL